MSEFFSRKLENFVEPDHTCTCNVCCLDMETVKRQAVDEALARVGETGRGAASSDPAAGLDSKRVSSATPADNAAGESS